MITFENVVEAQRYVAENWGEEIVLACFHEAPYNKPFSDFINHCTTCGGDWGGMLLSGVRALYPKVYDTIPDKMGVHAWGCICSTLVLLGIDTSA